ncbi:MAG: bifunctional 5,10-methylenetetrahydrofolate dehydrogenase/5,10-methenyltetrahydrofolate cyclohydrolase [Phycisphaerales bacterium]
MTAPGVPASSPVPARIIDGKALAQSHRERIAARVRAIRSAGEAAGAAARRVRLDALIIDAGDTAARQYAESQARTCAELGIEYVLHHLPAGATYDDVAGRVLLLNSKDDVAAIMVHLPLPEGIDPYSIQRLISPEKDVEGVNPANIGNVVYGRSSLAPCTALAAVKMIESTGVELRGKFAVVVGASNIVGKPIAVLLMRQDATVVSCNKWTDDLPSLTRRADVLVAAAGVAGLITRDMVKPGAVVIDVGVNRVPDGKGGMKTVGDVEFDQVKHVAGHLSPVPGGVGPMTVAMLLLNVVQANDPAGLGTPV